MTRLAWILVSALACTANDGNDGSGTTAGPDDTSTQADGPPDACADGAPFDASGAVCDGHAAVDFRIDDSASGILGASAILYWQGAFGHDPVRRTLNADSAWKAPFPQLYDDGPWDDGGHEPLGATAGDGIWGYTGFFDLSSLPGGDPTTLAFGAVRDDPDGPWIWNRANDAEGSFTVGPDDENATVDAGGLVMPAFGDRDLRVTVDAATVASLDVDGNGSPDFAGWDPADGMRIKSPWWDWIEVPLVANADNSQFSVELSTIAKDASLRTGLLPTDQAFWFVLALADGAAGTQDYALDGSARPEGVTVEVGSTAGDYLPVAIEVRPFNTGEALRIRTPR